MAMCRHRTRAARSVPEVLRRAVIVCDVVGADDSLSRGGIGDPTGRSGPFDSTIAPGWSAISPCRTVVVVSFAGQNEQTEECDMQGDF